MVYINDLVLKYKKHRNSHLKSTYNETQLRNDFIDPFLKCLGWDVDNTKGKTHLLRDVIQEEYIEIKDELTKKSPDYTLRINGTRKLFVEVKKPSVDILRSPESAFQIRRYGWSANLDISILTNFEYIIIYNCQYKPNQFDNEHVARHKVFKYEDYEKAIEEINSLISYQTVNSGELDNLFETPKRKGETFDKYFLEQIETWRAKLAKTSIKNNPDLDEEDVNYIIQRILNRIIFLRICEDREIKKYETIKGIKDYDELKDLFKETDKRFNSGLFDFIEDALTLNIDIDADILIGIFNELYFPQSPYDFSVVDPTILSQIYEQFLGRRVMIEADRTFNINEVPEVAASNGVVPTPKIIVEQIVRDTLTPIVENKNFNELCNLKIADICCGSGTFLISSYDFLLEKMLKQIVKEKNYDSDLIQRVDGEGWILTLKGKRNILENNLYGVDINPYATEVTKFSLLLKILEDENEVSVNNFIHEYSQQLLPNLKSNIKTGNSLVDYKFFDFIPDALSDDELLFKVKPFNWDEEYPEIIKKGGFNAIVGNPPYVRIQNMKKYSPKETKYYQAKESQYSVAKKATIDKYFLFVQRAIELLNPEGFLGYIVPHKFFITTGGKELRKFIVENHQISKIIHFGSTQVFPERSTYTAILILESNKKEKFEFKKINKISPETLISEDDIIYYETEKYSSDPWIFLSPETQAVFDKFESNQFDKLGNLTDISVGLQTSADKIYIFVPIDETSDTYIFKIKDIEYEVEKEICRPAIYDLSFTVFESIQENAQMIFPYTIEDGEAELLSEKRFNDKYPLTWKYLNEFKDDLKGRSLQGKAPKWYQYGRSQSLAKFHDEEKLIWSVLATGSPYVLDTNNLFFTGGGNGPYYALLNDSNYSLFYFLGILSHPVIEQMVKSRASEFRGAYYSHGKQFIENLPIKKIDFDNEEEVKKYNLIIENVKNTIKTKKQLKHNKKGTKRTILNRKLDVLNRQLIGIINDLYGISDKSFKTVMEDEMLKIKLGED